VRPGVKVIQQANSNIPGERSYSLDSPNLLTWLISVSTYWEIVPKGPVELEGGLRFRL